MSTVETDRLPLPKRFLAGAGQVLGKTRIRVTRASETGTPSIVAAIESIGYYFGLKKPQARVSEGVLDEEGKISEALGSVGLRGRTVALHRDWHKSDCGPMLAFAEKDGRALALIPTPGSRYHLVDPVEGTNQLVTQEIAETVRPEAWALFRPLPEGPVTAWGLLKEACRNQVRDILWIFFAALFTALLSLLTPVMTGVIINTVIPSAQTGQLVYIGAALVLAAVVTVFFNITSAIALLRVEGKAELSLQSAIWDRLLHLKMGFFAHYSAGDLAKRVDGINQIRNTISETMAKYILAAVFSLANFILIFYYSWKLAILAIILGLVAVLVDVVVALLQLKYQRVALNLGGAIANRIFEIISGITKWKSSASEAVAVDWWSELFFPQQKANKAMGLIRAASRAFDTAFPIITSLLNYAIFYFFLRMTMSAGDFLAYNAAFTQMLAALLTASAATSSIVKIGPLLERLNPVLKATEERLSEGQPADTLTGRLEVKNLAFRYSPEEEDVFSNVSFTVEPGQMTAIVGSSGCGKSTLLKLLIGFESPTEGSVEYDGTNLEQLDISTVRRQLGVVLQHQNIFIGDIYQNIVGSRPISEEDAWVAIEKAGLKEDIERLPLKLHTLVSQTGSTFSGGQLQRIFIARALAGKPNILLFDEATSALDNESQAIVSRNIEELNVTRLVIAHRLSTIRHADQILVLHNKTIAERGTFDELMARNGFFAKMAARQLG